MNTITVEPTLGQKEFDNINQMTIRNNDQLWVLIILTLQERISLLLTVTEWPGLYQYDINRDYFKRLPL